MAHAGEATPNPVATIPEGFRAGTIRGTEGYFRVGQDGAERWWLLEATGLPFFCRAVHGVRASAADGAVGVAPAAGDPATRLRQWGFNAVGAGGDGAGRDDGFAFMATVDFCRTGALIHAPGVRLPDVFAPDWPRLAAERALEVCAPLATCRELIGWLSDDLPGWAQARPSTTLTAGVGVAPRPGLLQICLSLEPNFAAYHAAWEFALALHGGRLGALARAWGAPLANKEVVRELTRTERGLTSRGYLRDEARWTREFARRYFTSTAAAIRAADSNHLLLGCRFGGPAGESVGAECVYPVVDVPLLDWTELPPAGARAPGPVLAGDVCWADENFIDPSTSSVRPGSPLAGLAPVVVGRARRLTAVERMLRRGRSALERAARHPAVVGYVWRQWLDEPGEQPPFARGLVHVNGAGAREHTELLAEFNVRAAALRRGPTAPVSP